MRLFWDVSNWQSMAVECHNRKTVREDGGFGARIKTVQPELSVASLERVPPGGG